MPCAPAETNHSSAPRAATCCGKHGQLCRARGKAAAKRQAWRAAGNWALRAGSGARHPATTPIWPTAGGGCVPGASVRPACSRWCRARAGAAGRADRPARFSAPVRAISDQGLLLPVRQEALGSSLLPGGRDGAVYGGVLRQSMGDANGAFSAALVSAVVDRALQCIECSNSDNELVSMVFRSP